MLIKGSEKPKILSDKAALASRSIFKEIKSAPKNKTEIVTAEITSDSSTQRDIIRLTPDLLPITSSSLISRVTAVQIPLVANVAANM